MVRIGHVDLGLGPGIVAAIGADPIQTASKARSMGAHILEVRIDLLGIEDESELALTCSSYFLSLSCSSLETLDSAILFTSYSMCSACQHSLQAYKHTLIFRPVLYLVLKTKLIVSFN